MDKSDLVFRTNEILFQNIKMKNEIVTYDSKMI